MRIDPRAPIAAGTPAQTRAARGRPFTLDQATPAAAGSSAAPAQGLIGLDAVLAIQANQDDDGKRRRRATRRGHDLLDSLESLKIALLSGRLPTQDIARL